MRISIIPGDPGYREWATGAGVRVAVNGKDVSHCVTADEEKGYVILNNRVDGQFFLTRGRIARHRVYGNVEVRFDGRKEFERAYDRFLDDLVDMFCELIGADLEHKDALREMNRC